MKECKTLSVKKIVRKFLEIEALFWTFGITVLQCCYGFTLGKIFFAAVSFK